MKNIREQSRVCDYNHQYPNVLLSVNDAHVMYSKNRRVRAHRVLQYLIYSVLSFVVHTESAVKFDSQICHRRTDSVNTTLLRTVLCVSQQVSL